MRGAAGEAAATRGQRRHVVSLDRPVLAAQASFSQTLLAFPASLRAVLSGDGYASGRQHGFAERPHG